MQMCFGGGQTASSRVGQLPCAMGVHLFPPAHRQDCSLLPNTWVPPGTPICPKVLLTAIYVLPLALQMPSGSTLSSMHKPYAQPHAVMP